MPSTERPPGGASTWTPPSGTPGFRRTGEEVLHRAWFVSLVRSTFEAPDGTTFERDIVRHPGAVAVVPVTEDDHVLLVHQYRPAVDGWLLEIPAGTCDVAGEPSELTAQRELVEEIGRRAGSLELLTRCLNTPGFCDEITEVFLATDLVETASDHQGIEEGYLSVEAVPLADFDGLVASGVIVDAATILGVGLARGRLAGRG